LPTASVAHSAAGKGPAKARGVASASHNVRSPVLFGRKNHADVKRKACRSRIGHLSIDAAACRIIKDNIRPDSSVIAHGVGIGGAAIHYIKVADSI
jgi:hypothetical protein